MLLSQPGASSTLLETYLSKLKILGSALLGISASVFCFSTSARAAEQVILKYDNTEITVPLVYLQTFALTGQAGSEDVQAFFEKYPEVGRLVEEVMLKSIKISPSFAQRFTQGAVGDFVLSQLNRLLLDPAHGNERQLFRDALVASYEDDNEFTLIEVISKYPAPELSVDLTSLQPVYTDVSQFFERIEPALETARGILKGLICTCPNTTATGIPSGTSLTQANSAQTVAIAHSSSELQSPRSSCATAQTGTSAIAEPELAPVSPSHPRQTPDSSI
jgi:hypothetical protein